MKPIFSIIIPAFNASATLAATLNSVAKQSMKDWEIIAVNDGSTDDTKNSIATYADERVKYVYQPNSERGKARNNGVNNAKGEWLAFLDADDIWQDDKLAIVFDQILQNKNVDFVYHGVFEKYQNGHLRRRAFNEIKNLGEFIEKGNPFVPSAVVMRKSLYLKHGGFVEDKSQVEDLAFWLRLLHNGIALAAINKPLTVYLVGSGVTANLNEHLNKVENALNAALEAKLISKTQCEVMLERKWYEAARQLQKLGKHKEAELFYNNIRLLNFKSKLLQLFNKLGISI